MKLRRAALLAAGALLAGALAAFTPGPPGQPAGYRSGDPVPGSPPPACPACLDGAPASPPAASQPGG